MHSKIQLDIEAGILTNEHKIYPTNQRKDKKGNTHINLDRHSILLQCMDNMKVFLFFLCLNTHVIIQWFLPNAMYDSIFSHTIH